MIDVRRLRDDLDAVKAALARRGIDSADVDRAAALYARQLSLGAERDGLRGEVNTLSKQVGSARGAGRVTEAEQLTAQSKAVGSELAGVEATVGRVEQELRDLLLRIPNLPAAEAPDGASEDDNPVLRVEGFDPERYTTAQRVPHWDIGRRARHPRPGAGDQDLGVDVPAVPRARGDAGPGPVPAGPGPQRRRLRGDPPADPGQDRDPRGHRPTAQVRRRRLPHRTGRPLGHPHRRGTADVATGATRSSPKPSCRCG